ncbi:MAG: signal transduction protein [Hyphomonadaceae bacterium JAD_PAG50586_4]|nr:MAG: signal transduction protein [Hyphomonadaceae bacterium JAD_PAG50586_4]
MQVKYALLAMLFTVTPAYAQSGGMAERLAALDLNRDGSITRAEAREARLAAFERADANHDGYLSEAERNAGGANGMMRQGLGAADTNGDGRVSRDEALAAPYRGFDRLDANNDGVISSQEMQAVRRFGG